MKNDGTVLTDEQPCKLSLFSNLIISSKVFTEIFFKRCIW